MPGEFFSVTEVKKSFAHLKALNGISVELSEGEILGLIGPNGSGKTTLINVISGIFKPDHGKIVFQGKDIGGMKPHKIAHIGINRTYQTPRTFNSLTVEENVRVATVYGNQTPGIDINKVIEDTLALTKLQSMRKEYASSLNTFHKKMLDLARALATSPKIILVDELAAGLNPDEMNEVGNLLKELSDKGLSLIVVEHVMAFIKTISERVVVMDAGEKIFEGDFASAATDEHVKEVYLGRRNFA